MDIEKYVVENIAAALENNYIQVYYQPVIRTISRKLCSFEGLARWIDPEIGMIRPDQFIPVLERASKIHILDRHIIREVCKLLRNTMDVGGIPIPVSINLSRLDFSLCDIFSFVDEEVRYYKIPRDFLYIEITESIMAEQASTMIMAVNRFRDAGYQVWMDDFGSAYSSLNVLKDFSFDEIKLDMRFLSSFSQRSRRILASVIQMETGRPSDMMLISAVFHNRLDSDDEDMRYLGSSATINYLVEMNGGKASILHTDAELSINSPYNTYTHQGLPPGPICMPGIDAISAALYPEPNCNYMYFCATGIDGGTAYATTLSQHEDNVEKYRENWVRAEETEETSEETTTESSGLVIVPDT